MQEARRLNGPVIERKEPSLFHRPARKTVEAQLDYAYSLYDADRKRKAADAFSDLVHQWPETAQAVEAQLALAQVLHETGRARKAFDELQYLFDFYPGQFPFNEAIDIQYRIANHLMTGQGRRWWHFSSGEDLALPLFKKIVRNAPRWEKTPSALFNIGLIHESHKHYADAVSSYERLIYHYSDSPYAAEATFRRASCLYRITVRYHRDEQAHRRAMSALSRFITDHAGRPEIPEAQHLLDALKERLAKMVFDRAVYYDEYTDHQKSAVLAYDDFIRQFPSSPLKAVAQERIRALKYNRETIP